MRVTIDCRHAGLPGIGRFAVELTVALRRRAGTDEEVMALVSRRPGGWLGDATLSVPAGPPGGDPANLAVASGPFGPLEQLELPLLLARHHVQLHHATHLTLPLALRLPMVLTVHDVHPLVHDDHARSAAARGYYRLSMPVAVRRARAVVAVSDYTAAELARVLGRPADAVIAHGVDHSAWAAATGRAGTGTAAGPGTAAAGRAGTPQTGYLLYVGTAKPHKNLITLLRAHAGARDDRGEGLPELVLAGPTAGEVEAVAPGASAGRVRALGRVADAELPGLYAGAAVVAVPSRYEGFGLTALEAMYWGVPVVAADSPGLRDTVADAALLVPASDPRAWADALARAAGDPVIRATLIQRGRARAGRFRWDDAADAYLALYRRLVRR
ncbi:MAG TPA: glycosyltransferase family 1 protein [Candidatus Dormibacteraeota bacterium]|nr:glycosyltransferase family 1 protein [Candidatus Dormibacteraeota bacterium]